MSVERQRARLRRSRRISPKRLEGDRRSVQSVLAAAQYCLGAKSRGDRRGEKKAQGHLYRWGKGEETGKATTRATVSLPVVAAAIGVFVASAIAVDVNSADAVGLLGQAISRPRSVAEGEGGSRSHDAQRVDNGKHRCPSYAPHLVERAQHELRPLRPWGVRRHMPPVCVSSKCGL